MPSTTQVEIRSVVSLWRYPVKSMMGEELNASEVTERGLVGDRAYALVDSSNGKVTSAKNPRKWLRLFDFRAALIEPPRGSANVPAVRIALPDGTIATSQQSGLNEILSKALNRQVTLNVAERGQVRPASAEEYWPDMDGLDHWDTVTDFALPEGTFFDCATVHLLTRQRSTGSGNSIRKGASRFGGFVPTSWWRPPRTKRALSRMPGSGTRSRSGMRFA